MKINDIALVKFRIEIIETQHIPKALPNLKKFRQFPLYFNIQSNHSIRKNIKAKNLANL